MFFCAFTVFIFLHNDVVAAATQHKHQEQIQTPLAEANNSSKTNVTSRSQHHLQNQHHQQNQAQQASSALPGESSKTSITCRREHHQQKPTSPAEAIITSTTTRTRHDKQHRQCRPKPAEPAVPADASISSRASFASRKPPQNQHQNPKPAPLAKTGRNKHHQQKTTAEPASKPEASIIRKNWQKQASPTENTRRTSINTRSQHH